MRGNCLARPIDFQSHLENAVVGVIPRAKMRPDRVHQLVLGSEISQDSNEIRLDIRGAIIRSGLGMELINSIHKGGGHTSSAVGDIAAGNPSHLKYSDLLFVSSMAAPPTLKRQLGISIDRSLPKYQFCVMFSLLRTRA